jgi:membrane-associated phospholipid phosphatase
VRSTPLRVAVAAALAFATLAGLVASDATTALDQWAGTHAMPFAGAPEQPRTALESLVPLLHADLHPAGAVATQVVTLPGQVVVSFLLVLVAARMLARRGRLAAAIGWTTAWILAVGVEVVCRHTLVRPPLHRDGVHVVDFDSSWPSGHALRCMIVAAAIGAIWPQLRGVLALWVATAAVMLELAGFHTPTDVLGGLLLATVAIACVALFERSGLLRRGAALGRAGTRATAR